MFMKYFKKVYVEITNSCNLNCEFCIKNSRKTQFMNFDNFKFILNKLENYTDYLYLHVLGEPLLHPKFNDIVDYASKNFKINVTTNGYLINNRNVQMMIKKIEDLMEDKKTRRKIGKKAKESVKKYTSDIVKLKWFKLLENGDFNE